MSEGQPNPRPRVVVSPNPVREKIMLDRDGNQVNSHDPRKKQIIKKAEDIK